MLVLGVLIWPQPSAADGFLEAVSIVQQLDRDLMPVKASGPLLR